MWEHCRPDIIVDRLEHLDQDDLWARGVRGLILDLDNTLCAWHSSEVSAERRAWVARARERFKLCILSNTIKFGRLRRVGDTLGIPTTGRWGLGRKPMPGGIRVALTLLGTQPQQTAIIGDQLFADVLGANLNGLLSVWVPVLDRREFFSTRLFRGLERRVLRRLGCAIPDRSPDET
ncbi:YqeG family HAD IIIA-type phosphatase [bacterium]|nr:YqeG family HAD IIIA-type phosphatase [bacterium]